MSETTARLALPCLAAAQGQKHVTHNEALHRLDALVQMRALDRHRIAPPEPGAPQEGDLHILAGPGEGVWQGHAENDLAWYSGGVWRRVIPDAGWRLFLADEGRLLIHDGGQWREAGDALGRISGLERFGLGAEPDAANPFTARLNTALYTALPASEGGEGDLRLVLNRESAGDTASVLFQSGWSGRAEIGLAGDDAFSLRVAADGAGWTSVLRAQAGEPVDCPSGARVSALNDGPLAGCRNAIINGGFEHWSRGEGLTTGYFADRWRVRSSGGLSLSLSREALAPGEVEAFSDCLDWSASGGEASDDLIIAQPIEGVRRFSGGPVTLSFYARAATPLTLQSRLVQMFGSGGTASSPVFLEARNHPATTAWKRFEHTLDLPALDGKVIGEAGDDSLELRLQIRAPVTDPSVFITGVQLEPGRRATPFEARPAAVERLMCARYFRRSKVWMPDATAQLGLIDMRRTPDVTGGGAGADFSQTTAAALIGSQTAAGLQLLDLEAEI